MPTHTLTIELSDSAYQSLQSNVESGKYPSANAVVEDALMVLQLPSEALPPADGRSHDEWISNEAILAWEEHMANPTEVYSSQQVLAYLADQRVSASETE